MNKTYLGDGVYVEIQEELSMIKLTTSDGIEDTNTIFMEPEVFDALQTWVKNNLL